MNSKQIIYTSKGKSVMYVALFGFCSVFLLPTMISTLFLGAGVFLFFFFLICIFCLIYYVSKLISSKPLFVFTTDGLWDYSSPLGQKKFVRWSDYNEAYLHATRGQKYISLYFGLQRKTRINVTLAEISPQSFYQKVNLYLSKAQYVYNGND